MEASELSLHVFGKKCGLAPRVGVFSEKNADWRHESACFRENMQTSDLSLHVFPKKWELVPRVSVFSGKNADF